MAPFFWEHAKFKLLISYCFDEKPLNNIYLINLFFCDFDYLTIFEWTSVVVNLVKTRYKCTSKIDPNKVKIIIHFVFRQEHVIAADLDKQQKSSWESCKTKVCGIDQTVTFSLLGVWNTSNFLFMHILKECLKTYKYANLHISNPKSSKVCVSKSS